MFSPHLLARTKFLLHALHQTRNSKGFMKHQDQHQGQTKVLIIIKKEVRDERGAVTVSFIHRHQQTMTSFTSTFLFFLAVIKHDISNML